MKLIELDPRWIVSGERKVGITFDCPHCHKLSKLGLDSENERLGVCFKNPIGGGLPMESKYPYNRTGDTFETLTLTPSIDASKLLKIPKDLHPTEYIHSNGHWHGYITNGEIK